MKRIIKTPKPNTDINLQEEGSTQGDAFRKKRRPLWFKIASIVFGVITIITIVILCYVNHILSKYNYDDQSNVVLQEETFEVDQGTSQSEGTDPDSIKWEKVSEQAVKVEGVFNILLLGEESIKDKVRGRSDCMIVVTLNTKTNEIKMTSLMRDTYVQIPGYQDNRLNAAYNTGGVPLLEETIKKNFNLIIDGYVLVDFDGFENIIDKLGGVKITLTQKEAEYLNAKNYISNPDYRTVVVGTQLLNGNQAMGYSRVRKIKTANNLIYDFGRTFRQRAVLQQIFESYKSKSLPELVGIFEDIMPMVTTDLSKVEVLNYLATVVSMGVSDIDTMSVPVKDGYYDDEIRRMKVLVPNLQRNIDEMHMFIYGENYVSSK